MIDYGRLAKVYREIGFDFVSMGIARDFEGYLTRIPDEENDYVGGVTGNGPGSYKRRGFNTATDCILFDWKNLRTANLGAKSIL